MRAYTSAESSALDVAAQESGVAGFELMRRAGVVAFEQIARHYPTADSLLVLAGKGNNGGDAWIVAGAAVAAGWTVQLCQFGLPAMELSGAAALARDWAGARGVVAPSPELVNELPQLSGAQLASAQWVVVDGLLGTGLQSAPRPEIQQAIAWLNAADLSVVALDLPSGLSADNGAVPGGWPDAVVRADLTVTFIGMKLGLLTGRGPDCTGELVYESLALDVTRLSEQSASAHSGVRVLDQHYQSLPARDRTAFKNQFGHVLVLAGADGGGGAALLAAESALRCGAGLVSVGTHAINVTAMLARRPELMVRAVADQTAASELAKRADTIVVGPGLGQAAWGQGLLAAALAAAATGVRLIIDADALNLLATGRGDSASDSGSDAGAGTGFGALPADTVLTPHPGEAARLLGTSTQHVELDRVEAVTQLARRYCCVVVLKGAGTLIADPSGLTAVCALGNPGMATAGMGDTLAGIVAGVVAQHGVSAQWVGRAVQFHAAAGDRAAARLGEASMLATDVIAELPAVLRGSAQVGTGSKDA